MKRRADSLSRAIFGVAELLLGDRRGRPMVADRFTIVYQILGSGIAMESGD
jgi:hypothetical protein